MIDFLYGHGLIKQITIYLLDSKRNKIEVVLFLFLWNNRIKDAEIVRYIYSEFLNGKGTTEIATNLEKQGAITSTGLERWIAAYIARVLRNPFYSGTVIYRKQYIPDYLEQKHKTNYGEVEKIIV